MQEYADPVIDWLDAGRGILAQRFFRDVSHISALIRNPPLLKFWSQVLYSALKRLLYKGPIHY